MGPRRRWLLPLLLLCTGCEKVEVIVDRYRDLTPHEAYAASLRDAALMSTALGRAWSRAAGEAVTSPARITLPHREEGYLPPEDPSSVGLRFTLERGQVVSIRTGLHAPDDSARLFVDLFRLPTGPDDPPRPVQEVEAEGDVLRYEPWRDGEYVLRLQPELLRGGRYHVTLQVSPALAFPVEGRDDRAIQSFFGAPRDGGSREHHGVDIFAPRSTPVLAAAEGVVSRVRETQRGGRVVWLRDGRRNRSLYYAHLDSQLVTDGQRVRVGDTVGLVGNSGNARTTPPHLHFGIYARGEGPLDPVPFLRKPRRPLPAPPVESAALGQWRRSEVATPLRSRAGAEEVLASLEAGAPFRVLAGLEDWYRVRTPDGTVGWIRHGVTEPVDVPLDRWTAGASIDSLRSAPAPEAPALGAADAGGELSVLARWRGHLWVQDAAGARAWVAGAGSP